MKITHKASADTNDFQRHTKIGGAGSEHDSSSTEWHNSG